MIRRVAALTSLVLALALTRPAQARVEVTIDQDALNDLITKMAPEQVPVKLAGGRSLTIRLEGLRVTGFDPSAGGGTGFVLAALRLKVPELGLDAPVEPRLSLQFRENQGRKVAYLRFEEVKLQLPVMGPVDLAPLLPLLPITTDSAWIVGSQRGDVRVEPKLTDAKLGQKNLRLGFDLVVTSAPSSR